MPRNRVLLAHVIGLCLLVGAPSVQAQDVCSNLLAIQLENTGRWYMTTRIIPGKSASEPKVACDAAKALVAETEAVQKLVDTNKARCGAKLNPLIDDVAVFGGEAKKLQSMVCK